MRVYSASLTGREQLVVYKFSDAIDIVQKTLAENAVLDSINMLMELRSQHEEGTRLQVWMFTPAKLWILLQRV